MRITNRWKIGEYTIEKVEDHGFSDFEGQPLYRFEIEGRRQGLNELYRTLDHAMVAAVGQKWTGPRGAGGSGTDTAAGWFMRMIGADHPLDEAATLKALETSIAGAAGLPVPDSSEFARRVDTELKRQGFGLAQIMLRARVAELEAEQRTGPLSSVPPADHNPPTVHGCDDCSVEPGETHRYPECPGAQRARARLAAESTPPAGTEAL